MQVASEALRDREERPARLEAPRLPALRLHPRNRLVQVGGTALLVNPETGNWLRLSEPGATLLRGLERQALAGGRGAERGAEGLPAHRMEAFVDTLVRGRFARRLSEAPAPDGPWDRNEGLASAGRVARHRLANVMLNVTRRCNLRCRHCAVYAGSGDASHVAVASRSAGHPGPPGPAAPSPEESTGRLLEVIERVAALGARKLVLFGGEPLLRDDIGRLLRFASEQIPELCVATNGTLLSDELCRLMVERVREVRVSLDGSSPRVHDELRGRGSFARTLNGIRSLVELGHRGVVIKTVISARNLGDIPNLVRLARRLGAALDLTHFIPLGRGAIHRREFLPDPPALLRAHQRVWLLAEYYELPSASFNAFCQRFMSRAAAGCGVGCGYVLVDCSGDVFPCEGLQYQPLRLGNVIAGGASRLRELGEVFDASVERLRGCARCELRYFCKGGCLAEAYVSCGAAGPASSLCGFYRTFLPPVICRFQPQASSWQNLQTVFDGLDIAMVRDYLRPPEGRSAWPPRA